MKTKTTTISRNREYVVERTSDLKKVKVWFIGRCWRAATVGRYNDYDNWEIRGNSSDGPSICRAIARRLREHATYPVAVVGAVRAS